MKDDRLVPACDMEFIYMHPHQVMRLVVNVFADGLYSRFDLPVTQCAGESGFGHVWNDVAFDHIVQLYGWYYFILIRMSGVWGFSFCSIIA